MHHTILLADVMALAATLTEAAPALDEDDAFLAAGLALAGRGYARPLFRARKARQITTRELNELGRILSPIALDARS